MFGIYLCAFGAVLAVMGITELLIPEKSFTLWKAWIQHRLFSMHGALLITLGLPLACNKPALLPTLVFIIGLALAFTGPFILLYADRIRRFFLSAVDGLSSRLIKTLMLADALARINVGIIFIYASGVLSGL